MVDFNKFNLESRDMPWHEFKKWIDEHRDLADESCDALQAVIKIGPEVACAAAVKWFRECGMQAQEVSGMERKIVDRVVVACGDKQESVIRDSASMFAGSGQLSMVVVMGFVSYSLIGVQVANELMKNQSPRSTKG